MHCMFVLSELVRRQNLFFEARAIALFFKFLFRIATCTSSELHGLIQNTKPSNRKVKALLLIMTGLCSGWAVITDEFSCSFFFSLLHTTKSRRQMPLPFFQTQFYRLDFRFHHRLRLPLPPETMQVQSRPGSSIKNTAKK
jgi:hypothetical protein